MAFVKHEGSMGDDFSILPQWERLRPAEKVGNPKESLIGQIEKEIPHHKKKRKKGLKTTADQEGEEESEDTSKDPEAQSGKIVDVTI